MWVHVCGTVHHATNAGELTSLLFSPTLEGSKVPSGEASSPRTKIPIKEVLARRFAFLLHKKVLKYGFPKFENSPVLIYVAVRLYAF